MPRWYWILRQLTRTLWVRATLIGLLGVGAAIFAALIEDHVPAVLPTYIGAEAVDGVLNIIATSMLAVTTFSLSVMTAAYSASTSNVSPRATRLLMEDRVSQNVLSTFIGSFLFSIVGIVVLKTGAYGERGRFVLFLFTIAVIMLIVVSLLRWIDQLTRLGRVGETTNLVEQTTREAMQVRRKAPCLGGTPLCDESGLPPGARAICGGTTGYLQHVDMQALGECCEQLDRDLFVTAIPGNMIYPDTPLAWLPADVPEGRLEPASAEIRRAFTIGNERSFDQDPRFGLAVMSEIACRALSPAMNDPGTAIDVLGRLTRLLILWAETPSESEPELPRVHVATLQIDDLFEDAFMLIARDGAAQVEVQLRLQKCLRALNRLGDEAFRAAARRQSTLAQHRAELALSLEADRQRLRAVAEETG
ncbi:MAG: hypothetical protein CME40_11580 [Haliea sp.]|nr:hypothetical protein [Haliea sp.]|tara:strand:+ start:128132 stop:129388 length:1257 start_codon:yes stop_codon:yes gene_type:complete